MNAIIISYVTRYVRTSLMTIVLLLSACTILSAEQGQYQQTAFSECTEKNDTPQTPLIGVLTVLSLNVAHGRKEAVNQMLVGEETVRHNLHEIAMVIKRTNADIVALQEADGPSRWSGGFDHVAELAQQTNYGWYCRAGHARSWIFDYGTALLSKHKITDVKSYSFSPTPLTPTKGFILGQISWYPDENETPVTVDVVSVHLDYSGSQIRQQQLSELMMVLSERKYPVIVLADLNSDWLEDESIVKQLVKKGDLQAYRPEESNLGTFRKNNRRLDWILISKELAFKRYSVLPDVVSDHYAITAEIVIKTDSGISE